MKSQTLQLIKTTLFVLFIPTILIAQLPNLGAVKNFAIFTSVGAIDNTSTTFITGNIGTCAGAITGFGIPSVVIGTIELGNALTTQCSIDVQAAYNEILAIPPTVVLHAPAFGLGETLFAGVYYIGGAGSLAGTLTLDGAGDTSSIFMFQFGGAFTTGAISTVNLINGALACNIFWIAEGAMTMAAGNDMKGTLIANNGAVSMGAGCFLEGRLLSTTGAASVYDAVIQIPVCGVSILPIELVAFTADCNAHQVVLNWRTATELNNSFFTIEQSRDGKVWEVLGIVAGAGNSSQALNYSYHYLVENVSTRYYKLKQTDFNGNFTHEEIIFLKNCGENNSETYSLYPNPSTGVFELSYTGNSSENTSIKIFNALGVIIFHSTTFQSSFDLSKFAAGSYVMRIEHNSEINNLKLMIN